MQLAKAPIHMWSVTNSSKKKSEEEKKCQATRYYEKVDKNCPTSDMQPVKLEKEMQLLKPGIPYRYTRLCNTKAVNPPDATRKKL